MGELRTVCLLFFVGLCIFQAHGADKYTDENRPYEFGFTIDGQQHRHEKKDKNGIIMGEFGFITADGVYHVTVYATDENGGFKILSMKNIRVKPYPTAPAHEGRKGHSLPLTSSQQLSASHESTKTQQARIVTQDNNAVVRACSNCKLPTTTTSAPKLASLAVISTNNNYNKQLQISGNPQSTSQNYHSGQVYSQYENSKTLQHSSQQSSLPNIQQQGYISSQSQEYTPKLTPSYPSQAFNVNNQKQFSHGVINQPISPQSSGQDEFNVGRQYLQKPQREQNYHQGLNTPRYQQQEIPADQYNLQVPYTKQNNQHTSNYPHTNTEGNYVQKTNNFAQQAIYQNQIKNPINTFASSSQDVSLGDRKPKTFQDILQNVGPEQQYKSPGGTTNVSPTSQQHIGKPVLVAAQMQIVDKNTNIYHKNPGESEGLPKGITKGDMTQLLYTFNYTVGFHGHHEDGYINGAKIGYYYVTGRNGVRTRVDYVADETGFHPRISQEILDIQSEEVPKPETERDAKYGLKGYEFKWLYYPVGSK